MRFSQAGRGQIEGLSVPRDWSLLRIDSELGSGGWGRRVVNKDQVFTKRGPSLA